MFSVNETEVAFFSAEDYGLYKANPNPSWWPHLWGGAAFDQNSGCVDLKSFNEFVSLFLKVTIFTWSAFFFKFLSRLLVVLKRSFCCVFVLKLLNKVCSNLNLSSVVFWKWNCSLLLQASINTWLWAGTYEDRLMHSQVRRKNISAVYIVLPLWWRPF